MRKLVMGLSSLFVILSLSGCSGSDDASEAISEAIVEVIIEESPFVGTFECAGYGSKMKIVLKSNDRFTVTSTDPIGMTSKSRGSWYDDDDAAILDNDTVIEKNDEKYTYLEIMPCNKTK